jgi:branched-chain amino acid transport system substrate-binding protein
MLQSFFCDSQFKTNFKFLYLKSSCLLCMKTSVIVIIAVVVIIVLAAGIYAITLTSTSTTASSSTQSTAPTSTVVTGSGPPVTTTLLTTSNGTATGTPYNIGIMEDETGGVATFANESIHMAQIAVDQINAAGGVNNHPLKLYSASEIPSASAAANTLVLNDHVQALVGITYAGDAVSLFPFLSQHQIVTIMTTASNNNLLQNLSSNPSAYQYFFRITPTDTAYSQGVMNFSSSVIKPASVYFVAENLDFAHELFTNISSLATAAGITVAGSTFVPLSQTDFATTVSSVVAAKPAMVIDAQTGSGAGTFFKELKANPQATGIKVLYMSNGALADPGYQGFLEQSDRTLLNGVVYQIEAGTASKPVNNVTSSLAATYHQVMGPFYPYYSFISNDYTAVQMLAAALAKANSFNASQIVSALQTVSYVGPTGTAQFNAQHDWAPAFWYTQIQNGKEQVIYPSSYATASYNATA